MKPSEMYALPEISSSNEIYRYEKFIDEVDENYLKQGVETCEGIVIKFYVNHSLDGESGLTFASLWIDGKPFMLMKSAGRGGDEYEERFITNKDLYFEAVRRLVALYDMPQEWERDLCVEDADIPHLDEMYGYTFDQFYNKDLVPKYKVDDIVLVKVNHGYMYGERQEVEARVQILSINQYNPYHTYFGRQLDWLNDYTVKRPLCRVYKRNEGTIHASFNDDEVVRQLNPDEVIEP